MNRGRLLRRSPAAPAWVCWCLPWLQGRDTKLMTQNNLIIHLFQNGRVRGHRLMIETPHAHARLSPTRRESRPPSQHTTPSSGSAPISVTDRGSLFLETLANPLMCLQGPRIAPCAAAGRIYHGMCGTARSGRAPCVTHSTLGSAAELPNQFVFVAFAPLSTPLFG